MTTRGRVRWTAVALLGLLQAAWLPAHAEEYTGDDPPSRAARLTALDGNVGIRSAGESDWSAAEGNRPLTTGDALDLTSGARAEIDFGGAQVRLDGDTQAYLDRLDDNVARVDVRSGTASLDIDDVGAGSAYELRTPTIAFAPSGDGSFRVDVDDKGVTTLTLFEGEGTVYGHNGAHYDVHGNQSYRFEDSELRNVVGLPRPERDGFDRWVAEREGYYDEGPSRQYVAQGVAGAADLDAYGRWESAADYGPVWYPTTIVVQDWAPYRYGRWRYVRPWGWTWIDDAPWGYAPFHYGRWVHVHNRWGWVPGPRYVRPVYSPALVGFVGGSSWSLSFHSGPPVGWFPLGPRDVYCPPYRYSRNYFTRVNVTNVTVNRTIINNVYEDVHVRGRNNHPYTYRNNNHATTVASRDDFENGRRLGNNRLRVSNDDLARADLTTSLSPPRGRDNHRGDDRFDRGNARSNVRDERPDDRDRGNDGRDNAGRGNDDRGNGGRGNAQVGSRDPVEGRGGGGFGNAPGRDERPDRGNADNDRGNDHRANAQLGTRDRVETRGGSSDNGNGGGNGNTRRYTPGDDRASRPAPSSGSGRPPSDGNAASNGNRRMWSSSDRDAEVRYVAPPSTPSRSYRSEPSPRPSSNGYGSSSRSSGSSNTYSTPRLSAPPNGHGAPPRAVPSQPATPPPAVNRDGGRSNQSGRGNQGPTRSDDSRGNSGNRQSRGQGPEGRNARVRN